MTYLLIILAILAVYQKGDRFHAAWMFVGLTILHDHFFGSASGDTYFLSAAIFDIFILIGLSRIETRLAKHLGLIAYISICCNAIGWYYWYNGVNEWFYGNVFLVLYGLAVIAMLRGEADVGRNKNTNHGNWFYSFAYQWLFINPRYFSHKQDKK